MEATVKAKKRNAVNPYSLIKFIKRFIKTSYLDYIII